MGGRNSCGGFKFHSSVIVGTGNMSACRWLKEFIAYSINSFPSPHTTSEEGMVEGGRERWRVLDLSSRPPPPSLLSPSFPPVVAPPSIKLLDDLPAKKCAPKSFFDLIFAFWSRPKSCRHVCCLSSRRSEPCRSRSDHARNPRVMQEPAVQH